MKEAVCRYCGKDIKYTKISDVDVLVWYYERGDYEPNGYLCTSRGNDEYLVHNPEYQHEPLTKEDKVLEILRTYENTTRLTNKH